MQSSCWFFLFSSWSIIKLVPLIQVCWQYGVLLLYSLSNWLFFLLIAFTSLINSMINPPPHFWSSGNCKVFPPPGSASTQWTSVEMMEVQAVKNQAMAWALRSECSFCLLCVVLCMSVLPLLLQTVTLSGLMSQYGLTLHWVSHQVVMNKEKSPFSGKTFWVVCKLWATVDPVPCRKDVSNFPCWTEI